MMEQILKTNISIPDWSFKSIDSDAYRKLEKSIIKNGQLETILVRHLGDSKYEVVDGKIVFEILRKLPYDYIWCKVIRTDRIGAKLIYLQKNYDFDLDWIEVSKAIKKINEDRPVIEISKFVNLSVKEIKALITLQDFDFERYKPLPQAEASKFF